MDPSGPPDCAPAIGSVSAVEIKDYYRGEIVHTQFNRLFSSQTAPVPGSRVVCRTFGLGAGLVPGICAVIGPKAYEEYLKRQSAQAPVQTGPGR